MKLAQADRYADQIMAAVHEVAPPDEMECAGSRRRRKPDCGDLDFVILPRAPGDIPIIQARFRQNCVPKIEGPVNSSYLDRAGFQLDVYFAHQAERELYSVTACNWGTLLICRTGSQAFNSWLAIQAGNRGMHWNPYNGVLDSKGGVIASETEEAVFKALGLGWVRPEDRER